MLPTEERFPSQVNASSITFPVIEEDTRPGFLGQAVLHISWARPKGQCTHLLNHDDVMYCIVLRNRNKHCHILCRFGAHNGFYSVFFCVTGCEYLTHYLLYIYSLSAECGGFRKLHRFIIDRVRGHG